MADIPFIQLHKVTKAFGKKVVLDELSLTVFRGETLVILGASGSGKSVMLRHIVGLVRPDSGQVIVDGEDVTDLADKQFLEVRRKVAYIFQGGALFDSMTVGENCAFGLREQRVLTRQQITARVNSALARVGLKDVAELYPANLSGGMRKRVALARSMALQPQCLLYDEPTAGLDPVTGFLVSDLIRKTAVDDVTSIVVTHDIPSAAHVANRIAFLENGRIPFIGTPSEARASRHPSVYRFLNAYESAS